MSKVHTIKMKIDIPLLRDQKQALLSCMQDQQDAGDVKTLELLQGLLNMLDLIHDSIDPPSHGPSWNFPQRDRGTLPVTRIPKRMHEAKSGVNLAPLTDALTSLKGKAK